MILQMFCAMWAGLFLVFTWLAFSVRSMKVYMTGCITAFLYFWAVTEGIVSVFHHNIPIVGFLVNPFPGTYQFIVLNVRYNWPYFVAALGVSLLCGIVLLVRIKRAQREEARPLSTMKVG
jgi:hypothetical protein